MKKVIIPIIISAIIASGADFSKKFEGKVTNPKQFEIFAGSIKKKLTKDEFESSAAYQDRVSKFNFNDTVIYFEIDSKYFVPEKFDSIRDMSYGPGYYFNPDKCRYGFDVDVNGWQDPKTYKTSSTIKIFDKIIRRELYTGTNAYGVSTDVNVIDYKEISVKIKLDSVIIGTSWGDNFKMLNTNPIKFESDSLNITEAKYIKGDVSYIIAVTFSKDNIIDIVEDEYYSRATISIPTSTTRYKTLLGGFVNKVIAIKTTTREIIATKNLVNIDTIVNINKSDTLSIVNKDTINEQITNSTNFDTINTSTNSENKPIITSSNTNKVSDVEWDYRYYFDFGYSMTKGNFYEGKGINLGFGVIGKRGFAYQQTMSLMFNDVTLEGVNRFGVEKCTSYDNFIAFGHKYIMLDLGLLLDFYSTEPIITNSVDGYSNTSSTGASSSLAGFGIGVRTTIPIGDKTKIGAAFGWRFIDDQTNSYFNVNFGILGKKREGETYSGSSGSSYQKTYYPNTYYPKYYYSPYRYYHY